LSCSAVAQNSFGIVELDTNMKHRIFTNNTITIRYVVQHLFLLCTVVHLVQFIPV